MKYFLITFLLFSSYCYSQKQYEFDYLIEYEVTYYKDSVKTKNRPFTEKDKTIKKYYLTNAKKNNYVAVITELDSLKYVMIFIDQNGIFSNVNFLKAELNKAEFINIGCESLKRYQNNFKYQINNYDFLKLNDTVINNKAYSMFKLTSIKPKRKKRKKIGTEYYIIDKETSFHLPILDFSTAYEEWKSKKVLPNGIFFEKYFLDYYGKLVSKERLIKVWKINKKIVIDNDCDYTKNKLKTTNKIFTLF